MIYLVIAVLAVISIYSMYDMYIVREKNELLIKLNDQLRDMHTTENMELKTENERLINTYSKSIEVLGIKDKKIEELQKKIDELENDLQMAKSLSSLKDEAIRKLKRTKSTAKKRKAKKSA